MILTSHVTHTLVIWGKMMQNIHIWLKHFMLKRSRSRSLTKLRREMRYVLTHRWVSAFSCTEGIHNVSAIVDKLFVVWACWPLRVFIETQMMILLMLIFPLLLSSETVHCGFNSLTQFFCNFPLVFTVWLNLHA